MYVVKITACFLSVIACRTALLMMAFFASLPAVRLACPVKENSTRRRSKTEFSLAGSADFVIASRDICDAVKQVVRCRVRRSSCNDDLVIRRGSVPMRQ